MKNVTTGDAELVAAMKGNYAPVDSKVPLLPGDVVLFWHRPTDKREETDMAWQQNLTAEVAKPWYQRDIFLDHAAVYVRNGLFFHKGAIGEKFPWVFVDAANLKADYEGGISTVHRPTRPR